MSFSISPHVVYWAFKLQGNRLFLMSEKKRTLPNFCVMFKIQKKCLVARKDSASYLKCLFFLYPTISYIGLQITVNMLFLISDGKDNDRFMCDIWNTNKCLVTRKDSASYLKCLYILSYPSMLFIGLQIAGNSYFWCLIERIMIDLCVMFEIQKVSCDGKCTDLKCLSYISPCCILVFKLTKRQLCVVFEIQEALQGLAMIFTCQENP